jgi:hypothetical protein
VPRLLVPFTHLGLTQTPPAGDSANSRPRSCRSDQKRLKSDSARASDLPAYMPIERPRLTLPARLTRRGAISVCRRLRSRRNFDAPQLIANSHFSVSAFRSRAAFFRAISMGRRALQVTSIWCTQICQSRCCLLVRARLHLSRDLSSARTTDRFNSAPFALSCAHLLRSSMQNIVELVALIAAHDSYRYSCVASVRRS